MTIVGIDAPGLARLGAELDTGAPVILPLPSPLPYVVVGADPAEVNAAKERPRDQSVGVALTSLAPIASDLELNHDEIELAQWLLSSELVGLLVPVGGTAPEWLAPAISQGMAFLGGAWLPELAELRASRAALYMSSANRTTAAPAVCVAEAEAIFGDGYLVADGEALRDPTRAHGSSSMVAIARGGDLSLVRDGINNAAFRGGPEAYLRDLRRRWAASR